MTDKQKVLAKFPNAILDWYNIENSTTFYIMKSNSVMVVIGEGSSEYEAWKNASDRIINQ